jgi:hypothetical protein
VEAGCSRKLMESALWKSGDVLTLALDCRQDQPEACLKLQAGAGGEHSMAINTQALDCPGEWLLVVGLTKSGSCVTIESAKRRGTPAWRFK